MRKINAPLIIAGILLIIILAVILFPELFTDKSPYNLNKMIFSEENGETVVQSAPFSPSKEFWLGTDDMGRDIYSYVIYGTRLTILLGVLIALGRFVIATPLAIFAGFGSKGAKTVIKVFNVILSAVPAVLVSIIILKIGFFVRLDRAKSILSFVIVLSLVGWPRMARLIMERVENINSQPYIRSEVALGKKRYKIALDNVFPHLAPELLVLQLMEVARALAMVMVLGIFNVFVGNLRYVEDPEWGLLNLSNVSFDPRWGKMAFYKVSFEPEWASTLSTSRSMLTVAPWAVLAPAFAFFMTILAINLLGEGLRNTMQRKDSRVIPIIRKLINLDFVSLWKQSKKSSKVTFCISIILILGVVFVPYFININKYNIKASEEIEIPFEQVYTGSEEAEETAQIIAAKMQDIGIVPFENNCYYMDYDISTSVILSDHSADFYEDGVPISAELNKDYTFVATGSIEHSGLLYDATKDDMFNIEDYTKFENKFILLDKKYYEGSAVEFFIDDIQNHVNIIGVLIIAGKEEEVKNIYIEEDNIFKLLVSEEFANKLKETDEIFIEMSSNIKRLSPYGRNIAGVFGDYNPENDKNAIIVGMNYNYTSEGSAEILKFNLNLMEMLCKTYDNQRLLIFMFIDGTLKEEYNGLYHLTENMPYSSGKVDIYIDLTRLSNPSFDKLEFSNALAPFTKPFSWSIGNQLEKGFNSRNIELEAMSKIDRNMEYYLTDSDAVNLMFWNNGIATVVVGSEGQGEKSIYEIGEVILKVINENAY